MLSDKLAEPWLSFFNEIDGFFPEETHFHCLGGFVITQVYGAGRSTADVDGLTLVPKVPRLFEFAGAGSALHKQYKVYLDPVGIAPLTENYEDRLTEIYLGMFKQLKLFALDPYDLALAKIERNTERDRDDVKHLARVVPFDLKILKQRYNDELRVYVKNETREGQTLDLWMDMIEEERSTH